MTSSAPLQRVTAATVVSVLALCTACGGESSEDGGSGGGTQTQPLCDGSDTIRLLYRSGGGYVEQSYAFTNPHGHVFLAVMGNCEAFVGESYMKGLRSRTLSEQQAASLSKDLGRDQLAAWSKFPDTMSCPDAGSTSISDGTNVVSCSCGCDPDVPAGVQAALEQAAKWKESLLVEGTPLSGPVAAAALPDDNPQPSFGPFSWPLSWPVTELPSPYTSSTGTRIEDATEAAALRQLRADALSQMTWASYTPIVDSTAARFQLYVRDELPAEVEAALQSVE